MAFRLFLLACLVAYTHAGVIAAPAYGAYAAPVGVYGHVGSAYPNAYPAVSSQQQNILRSYGNLGQVTSFSKTVDTPFSSVSKADVRVSNPGYAVAAPAYAGYAAPAYAGYTAPAYSGYAAPAYSGYAAPALAHGYAAPAIAHGYAAPAVHAGLLGVAYSAAPTVSHMAYSNGLGLAYNW